MEFSYTNYCCVHGCRNKQTDGKLAFFPLPKEPERRSVWLRAIGRNDLFHRGETFDKVCAKHFAKASISEIAAQKLMPNAMPSKYLPSSIYFSPRLHEHEEGISEVGTQTEISYGNMQPEKDVYVEVFGRTVRIKKEKDPENEGHRSYMSTFQRK